MFLPSLKGKGRRGLALLCLLLFPLTFAQASPDNQADVELRTNISTMAVQITQGAPLPPGGCVSGYLWHTTYGGCRRAQTQSEAGQCPAGYTGSRIRYRTAYILQANPGDIAYEGWGAWQDGCTPARAAGVFDTVIAKVRGAETGGTMPSTLYGNMASQMQVNYGTMYGVTIYRPTAELNCLYASGTTSGSGESASTLWSGALSAPGASVTQGSAGYCQLSNGNRTAQLYGSCDSSSGGDGDFCQGATRVVNITSAGGCLVTTETRQDGRLVDVNSYYICY